jgi:hypothetical protein
MLRQCPNCAAPRVGDEPVCWTCGSDLGNVGAAVTGVGPAAQSEGGATDPAPAAPGSAWIRPGANPSNPDPGSWGSISPDPVSNAGSPMPPLVGGIAPGVPPTTCWRCRAPIYPGQPFCANCGFDYRALGMTLVRNRRTRLFAFGAIAQVLLVAVSGFAVLTESSGWNPAAEPSPRGTWYSFTSPDKAWSVMFPSSATPQIVSQTMPVGRLQVQVTYYMVSSDGVVYEAGAEEVPSGQLSSDSKTNLDGVEEGIKIVAGITDSRELTFQGKQARELKFTYTNLTADGYMRFWASGTRVYMLMVAGKRGSTMYPEHFFDTFDAS